MLRTILAAGMSGPSCVNARDWSFIVVRDSEILNKMADANGRPAEPLRSAKLAGFTPFWIGLVFYLTGLWKKGSTK